jgi:phosphoglycolate phosphatase
MKKYKIILLDLDGTLTDPKVGITKSVQYALEKMSIVEPELSKLECFIGPPLQDSFAELYGFDEIQTQQAISYYRDRFIEKGMFENEVYPGIPVLLENLKKQEKILVVATSKPTVFSEQILKYFQLEQYFDLVVGSNLDGSRISKTDIIHYILNQFKEYKQEDFIMIGDRKHDLIGANNNGIHSIGVTYGYGSCEELSHENPILVVDSVMELERFLQKKLATSLQGKYISS